MTASKPWYLYLLLCRDGSYYAGISNDLAARFQAHLQGRGARYTRAHPPQRLLASRRYPDRAAASRAEYALKRLPRARKLAWLMHDGEVPVARSPRLSATPSRTRAGIGTFTLECDYRAAPKRARARLPQSPAKAAGCRCNDNNPSSSESAT